MSDTLDTIFSFSIALAALIGWIRFRRIHSSYYPFLICIWVGFVNEIISYLLRSKDISTGINNTIYVLIESLLITWQFKRWFLFKGHKHLFILVLVSLVLAWTIEALLRNGINYTMSYYRIFYPIIVLLMSLTLIGERLSFEKINFLKNPIYLICIAFVIYFTDKVIVGMFWLYSIRFNKIFSRDIVSYPCQHQPHY